ncbi:hypothetical protein SLEP1_g40584 [Rubroshorea leprosula]|uniref:Thaumatin-like protein n=1 Tax=Rubroshorea leprosula TaxID=152421 RepID=A0AAV5L3V1_9ROSI|nr:hypothetical protein SLEP1_g40584 [Rubroshorea leprosula]
MSSLLLMPMVLAVFSLQFPPSAYSSTFTIRNKCSYPVSLGILSGARTPELSTKCFLLQAGESTTLFVPTSWSGRLWRCTLCTQDSSGKFSCLTGDYGYSTMACSGGAAAPPDTATKFTLNVAGGLDFYAVSLVDPMMVVLQGGTGYAANLNEDCPVELKIIDGSNEGVACKSACDAFRDPQHCCSGACTSPGTCKPSSCSEFFKNARPPAYTYSYDDGTSTFICVGADDIITFCPGLSTRLNLIANAAETKPCTYKKLPAEIKLFPAETKPCTHKKFPAKTEPFPSHVVHALPRNRRLLWNLDKVDPPTPPAPSGNPPIHE